MEGGDSGFQGTSDGDRRPSTLGFAEDAQEKASVSDAVWISFEAVSRDGWGVLQELASDGAGDEAFGPSHVCPGRTIQPRHGWMLERACRSMRPGVTRQLGRRPRAVAPTACSHQNSANTSELCLSGWEGTSYPGKPGRARRKSTWGFPPETSQCSRSFPGSSQQQGNGGAGKTSRVKGKIRTRGSSETPGSPVVWDAKSPNNPLTGSHCFQVQTGQQGQGKQGECGQGRVIWGSD